MQIVRFSLLVSLGLIAAACSSSSRSGNSLGNAPNTDGGGDEDAGDPGGGSGGASAGSGGTASDAGVEPDGAAPVGGSGGLGGTELPEGLIASGLQVHEVLGSGLTNGGGVLDGIGYFFTEQEEGGLTLTRTDGTVDGTQSVTSVAESFSADPAIVFSMPDRMYWMGLTVDDGKRWFSSDGTAAGTQVIAGFPSIDPGGTDRGARLGDSVVFATADAGGLRGVSTLDLTTGTANEISASQFSVRSTGGTFALLVDGSDVYLTDGVDPPMIAMSFPNGSLGGAIQLGTEMLFWWNFGSGQMEMWKTSYAAEAAEKVMDVQAFQHPVVYQDKVYAISKTNFDDFEYALWETDGTAAGTNEVVLPGRGLNADMLWVTDEGLFFLATYEQEAGLFLYKSDGTAVGTSRVMSHDTLYSGPGTGPVIVGDYLYVGFEWGAGGTAGKGLARVPIAGGPVEYVDTPDCAVFNMVAAGNHLLAHCNYGTLRLLGNAGD